MKHNLYLNFWGRNKGKHSTARDTKEEEKSFYDKVLEERIRLETSEAAIEIVAKIK